jgi:hypothetical protein
VRRAERELAAQTARIGVATADLYPRFTLLAAIGLEAPSFSNLFSGANAVYNLGPQMRWNVFDAGRIRQNIEVQNARQEQALIVYEAAVLTALKDVDDVLIAYAKELTRRQSLPNRPHAGQLRLHKTALALGELALARQELVRALPLVRQGSLPQRTVDRRQSQRDAARLPIGAEGRIVPDGANFAIPATVSFVSPEAQFTPKQVETRSERDKLMFHVKVQIPPKRVIRHIELVKTGIRGVAYVRLDDSIAWPAALERRFAGDPP